MSSEFQDFNLNIDLSNTKEWDGKFQLTPPGSYVLEIVDASQETAKSSGGAMIKVTYQVVQCLSGEADQGQGFKVINNYSLSEKAYGRLKSLLIAAKAPLDRLSRQDLVGAQIIGEVIHTRGKEQVDAMGQPVEAKVFANVVGERPLEEEAPAQTAPPPAARKPAATTKANGTTAARR